MSTALWIVASICVNTHRSCPFIGQRNSFFGPIFHSMGCPSWNLILNTLLPGRRLCANTISKNSVTTIFFESRLNSWWQPYPQIILGPQRMKWAMWSGLSLIMMTGIRASSKSSVDTRWSISSMLGRGILLSRKKIITANVNNITTMSISCKTSSRVYTTAMFHGKLGPCPRCVK